MNESFSRVSVVGLGYIGLPTAAMLASHGVEVVGVDINQQAVDTINQGRIHIVEPGLEDSVQAAVKAGKLRATTTPEAAQVFMLAVPTPFAEGHQPDVSYIRAAAQALAPVLEAGNLVILESTSPVGTTEQLAEWLAQARPDLTFPHQAGEQADVHLAYCPERVLPGKVVEELVNNDRVIGGMTARCAARAADLYRTFVRGEFAITSARAAEMCKLTENAFRDVNIAFANELSLICERIGIDVWELIRLANRHPRVNILQPGAGVGGHCIAVDPWFIVASSPDEARLIRTAREVNDGKPHWVVEQVEAAMAEQGDATLACYGLAFKPDIDDLRESPALQIVRKLASLYPGKVLAVEPNIDALPADLQSSCELVTAEAAAQRAQVHVMLVDHTPFKQLARPDGRLVDVRGVWG